MEKALEQEVAALIANSIKPVTDQVGQLAKAVEPVSTLVTQVGDLGKNLKIVADTVATLPPAAAAATKEKPKEGEPKYLTAEDLDKVLDNRDAKRAGSAKRDAYIAEKLKDVPKAYHASLGADESKWAAEEQAIRTQVQADLKSLGATVPNRGGAPETATSPANISDPHKLPAKEFAARYLPKVPGAADTK